jgi:phage gpG-like protein
VSKKSEITFNLDGLEDIRRKFGDSYVARVGILGGDVVRKAGDTGLTNSELGVIHEFGSDTNNIPPRSFLRMPIETHAREIFKGMDNQKVKEAVVSGDAIAVFKILGMIAEGFVKLAFASGGFGKWPALKQETIARKGSSAPLIDTGQLRRSISSDVVKKGAL